MKQKIFFSLLTLWTFFSLAETDPAINDALKDTQDLLKDKSKRQEDFNRDAKAKAADEKVQNLTGGDSQQTQAVYDISADAFSSVMQSAGNDPEKAMELLQKAQTNPEAFYNSLPKETRDKIRGVAGEIDKKKAPQNKP